MTDKGTFIVDATTGEVLEDCPSCHELRQKIAELEEHLAVAEVQRKRAGMAEAQAKRMLREAMESDPKGQDIRAILNHWQAFHPRAKCPASGKRAQVVKKALSWGYSVDELKLALDGLQRFPFVGPTGRVAVAPFPDAKRYDDVEHALGTEKRIETCMAMGKPEVPENVTEIRPAPPREIPTGPAIDRVLGRLNGVKPQGLGQWLARCPAHDDAHASLSVAQGDKGVVARCHAGCESGAIAEAVGIPLAEWFDPDPASLPAPKRQTPDPLPPENAVRAWHDRLLAHEGMLRRLHELKRWTVDGVKAAQVGWDGQRLTFPVRDLTGNLVNVGRYLPGGSPKMLGLRHRERGLFPAPEMHRAGTLWLLEGEPDAVTCLSLGLAGVALPGVNGWRKVWAARFTGRRVVVVLDCDDPGRKAALSVARDLSAVTEVRVIDLEPARSDGFDLSDWVVAGGTREGLEALVSASRVDVAA